MIRVLKDCFFLWVSLMFVFTSLWVLFHLILIELWGQVIIQEPNSLILRFEIVMAFIIVLAGFWRLAKDIKRLI